MAAIVVSIPIPAVAAAAAKATKGKHPKLIVRGVTTKEYVTVPYAPSTGGSRSGAAPTYARQQRPGRPDLVIRQFEPTDVLALDLYFAHPDYFEDVEKDIAFLETLADHDEAVILQGCSPTWAGPWYITELTYEYSEFQPYTNRVTRSTAHVQFTAATDVHLPTGPVNGGVKKKKATHKATHKKAKAKPKFYVVKRGDTLSGIAAKVLHHANLWGRIASLNHIRNPNSIYPGQKLRLP